MAQRSLTDAEWHDLVGRCPRRGVYAVRTTGIFCAFGCPSRPPLRQNTVGFDTAAEALANGFRACRRCGGVCSKM